MRLEKEAYDARLDSRLRLRWIRFRSRSSHWLRNPATILGAWVRSWSVPSLALRTEEAEAERVERGGRLCRESIWVRFSGQAMEDSGDNGNLIEKRGYIRNFPGLRLERKWTLNWFDASMKEILSRFLTKDRKRVEFGLVLNQPKPGLSLIWAWVGPKMAHI